MEEYLELYVSQGFSIIPALPIDKKAAVPWKEYQDRRPSPEEIEEWKEKYWSRGFNIAVISGGVSGNLVVLDFDTYSNPLAEKLVDFDKLLGYTWVVETPSGGFHVYLRTKTPTPSFNITHDGRNIVEVRGVGRYVLAPPSIAVDKRSGTPRRYRFISITEEIPIVGEYLPYKLQEIVREKLGLNPQTTYSSASGDRLMDTYRLGKPYRGKHPPCIENILKGLPEGVRNEAAMRLASYLLHLRKIRPEEVLRRLMEWNQRNRPPLPDREIETVFRNVLRKGYSYGCSSMKIFGCNTNKCKLYPGVIGEDDWW
ncbi:MAG: bifunctional DNA primase/polymerase [Nitrososphaerota archaeon]